VAAAHWRRDLDTVDEPLPRFHATTESLADASLGEMPDDLPRLLPLIGERVLLVHPRRSDQNEGGGGDVDLFVDGLDRNWPLRLPSGWRLCQLLHYDVQGWYWVLDHEGATLALDTVADPGGLGRDGLPAQRLIGLADEFPMAARAAYLTAKRIRKGNRDAEEWERIAAWAATAPDEYERALSWAFGDRMAGLLATRGPNIPSERLLRRARRVQWLRRRATPARMVASLHASTGRWYRRLAYPTGLYVLVVGPDGAGKTSLADALPDLCAGPFRRWIHLHWRPGVLPRAGALVGVAPADPTRPHAQVVHGPVASLASLAYHWLDFLAGGWLRLAPLRIRSGLIVLERGWWDIAVDPQRYRISAPNLLVRLLGTLLPRPDLVLVLEATPKVLMSRKSEVQPEELARQTMSWHSVLPHGTKRVYIDASLSEAEVRANAREAVFAVLTERACGRLGAGWMGLPSRSSPRWLLPRGPRSVAVSGLSVYQPVTPRARVGWEAGRALAATGLFRLFPRADGPPEKVRELVARHIPSGATLAVMRTNHAGRYVVTILGRAGEAMAVAKVALDDAGEVALDAEAQSLEAHAPFLSTPVRAPRILDRTPGVLLLEATPWSPRLRPWMLPREVAFALGKAFAASAGGGGSGMAHGDCAPWNLLKTPDGWVLVDWEDSRPDAPPFFDVFHFFVQSAVLLRRPALRAFTRVAPGTPWMRDAIKAYADASQVPASAWRRHLGTYLSLSREALDPSDREQALGIAARERLLRSIG
jgi:hypothetical protein